MRHDEPGDVTPEQFPSLSKEAAVGIYRRRLADNCDWLDDPRSWRPADRALSPSEDAFLGVE